VVRLRNVWLPDDRDDYGARSVLARLRDVVERQARVAAAMHDFGFNHNYVGGPVTGRVIFDSGDGTTYSCQFNDWILSPMGAVTGIR
jgi:hypothetical protein